MSCQQPIVYLPGFVKKAGAVVRSTEVVADRRHQRIRVDLFFGRVLLLLDDGGKRGLKSIAGLLVSFQLELEAANVVE